MFNVARILEKIFKGFDIDADTQIIEGLAKEDTKDVFIVKKSHYYITLLTLPTIIGILIISIANAGLFFYTEIFPLRVQGTLTGLLALNMLIWFGYIVSYLKTYSKNYGIFKIMRASKWIPVLQKGDDLFRSFFNQTIFLIFFYLCIVIFFVASVINFIHNIDFEAGMFLTVNTLLFIVQFQQIIHLLRRFINLEMDFVIVTEDHIKHFDQRNLGIQTKTLEVNKVKTIRSNKTGILRSVLDYGEVHIFTDGDTQSGADLSLRFIKKPEAVERLLNDIQSR